jgi:hypothetical protein
MVGGFKSFQKRGKVLLHQLANQDFIKILLLLLLLLQFILIVIYYTLLKELYLYIYI